MLPEGASARLTGGLAWSALIAAAGEETRTSSSWGLKTKSSIRSNCFATVRAWRNAAVERPTVLEKVPPHDGV